MTNLLIKRLEKLEAEVNGIKAPPLFVTPFDDSEILGFSGNGSTIMRLPNESIHELQKRSVKAMNTDFGILLTAVTKNWGNWPYMEHPTPDRWCQQAKDYYQSSEWKERL